MENKYIYVITVFEDLDKKYGIKGGSRCFGYYFNFEDADKAIRKNKTDINEYTYSYAIIEEIPEGISQIIDRKCFYKFDYEKRKYYPIDEPEELKGYCNFSIG